MGKNPDWCLPATTSIMSEMIDGDVTVMIRQQSSQSNALKKNWLCYMSCVSNSNVILQWSGEKAQFCLNFPQKSWKVLAKLLSKHNNKTSSNCSKPAKSHWWCGSRISFWAFCDVIVVSMWCHCCCWVWWQKVCHLARGWFVLAGSTKRNEIFRHFIVISRWSNSIFFHRVCDRYVSVVRPRKKAYKRVVEVEYDTICSNDKLCKKRRQEFKTFYKTVKKRVYVCDDDFKL